MLMDGFAVTLAACKALDLDISNVPLGLLQVFYLSGAAFAEQSGTTPEQQKLWRDSVLDPKHRTEIVYDSIATSVEPLIQVQQPALSHAQNGVNEVETDLSYRARRNVYMRGWVQERAIRRKKQAIASLGHVCACGSGANLRLMPLALSRLVSLSDERFEIEIKNSKFVCRECRREERQRLREKW